jgi:hypothetical protein
MIIRLGKAYLLFDWDYAKWQAREARNIPNNLCIFFNTYAGGIKKRVKISDSGDLPLMMNKKMNEESWSLHRPSFPRKSNVMKRKIILAVAAIFGNVIVILGTAAIIFGTSVILYHGFF